MGYAETLLNLYNRKSQNRLFVDTLHSEVRKAKRKLKLKKMKALEEATEEIPIEFDPAIWRIVVEKVLVGKDNIRFIMIGGKEYSFRIY